MGNKSHVLTVLTIALIIGSLFYICFSEIGPVGYIELRDLADKLDKGGYPNLKEEVKNLMKTQGKIKGYQYLGALQNYRNIGKDLDLQEAKKKIAS